MGRRTEEEKRANARNALLVSQQIGCLPGERDQMGAFPFHALGGNAPDGPLSGVQVEFLPKCMAKLAGAHERHRQQ
jgi:hypothetical protein